MERPLSNLEHLLRCRTSSGVYRSFNVSAVYSKELTIPGLKYALRQTLLKYPILACNIKKTSSDCYYTPVDIKFLDVIERPSNFDSINEDFLKYINGHKFTLYSSKPLFKLYLVDDKTLTVVLEHTISDGLVGPYFHESILHYLAEEKELHSDLIVTKSELYNISLTPPIDLFMKNPLDPKEITADGALKNVVNFKTPFLPDSNEELWPGRFPTTRDSSIAFKFLKLTPLEVDLMVKKCRSYNVTITSYIHAVLVITIDLMIDDGFHSCHRIAMSLRKFIPNFEGRFIATAALVGEQIKLRKVKDFSWQLVQNIDLCIKKQVVNENILEIVVDFLREFDKTGENREYFTSAVATGKKVDTIKLSNLGVFDLKEDGGWSVTEMFFAQDVVSYSAEFMLNIITTPISGMNLVLSFFELDDSIDSYVFQFKENILKYLD